MLRTLSFLMTSLAVSSAASAAPSQFYTASHGDIAIEYDPVTEDFGVFWELDAARVDGAVVTGEFDLGDIAVVTDLGLQRPAGDTALALLGVDPGQNSFYLPADSGTATINDVPFMGWSNEVPGGIFVNDEIKVRLLGVTRDDGPSGVFSLWNVPFIVPQFSISTADGIDSSDELVLAPGHDHFNLNFGLFSEPTPLVLNLEVHGDKVGGGTVREAFDLHVVTCDGNCPDDARPVPATTPIGMGMFALMLLWRGRRSLRRTLRRGGVRF